MISRAENMTALGARDTAALGARDMAALGGGHAAALGARDTAALDRTALESLYRRFNDRRHLSCDPIELVHRYESPRDREIAALVASSLAFGNVKQIRASAGRVLYLLGNSPAEFLLGVSAGALRRAFRGFRHRWITGDDMASMLHGVRKAMREYGSLGELFYSKLQSSEPDIAPSAARFAEHIFSRSDGFRPCLLPSPASGSACKRLNLFLRWMVRSDEIDPGDWDEVPASMLIVPLDVHMHRISKRLGLTRRRAADLRTAREITDGFREIAPEDPVRYDFALTRLGILRDGDEKANELLGLPPGIDAKERDVARSHC